MSTITFNLVKLYKRLLIGIISSIAGIAGLFYSFGFIAEEARKSMIGISGISIPYQEYLFTGADFFISLPFILVNFFNPFSNNFFWGGGVLAIFVGLQYFVSCLERGNSSHIKYKKWGFIGLQFLLCIISGISFVFSSGVLEASGLLLPETNFSFAVGTERKILNAIFSQTPAQKEFLSVLYGWIEMALFFFGYNLWRISTHKVRDSYKPVHPDTLEIKSLLLDLITVFMIICFVVHLILLPLNYGRIMKGDMRYPVVQITFKEELPEPFAVNIIKMWLIYDNEKQLGVYMVHQKQNSTGGKLIVFNRELVQTIELLDKTSPFKEKG
jgi:hypothetical protein